MYKLINNENNFWIDSKTYKKRITTKNKES